MDYKLNNQNERHTEDVDVLDTADEFAAPTESVVSASSISSLCHTSTLAAKTELAGEPTLAVDATVAITGKFSTSSSRASGAVVGTTKSWIATALGILALVLLLQ